MKIKEYYKEINNSEFKKILNKKIGDCTLEEIDRIRNTLIKGLQIEKTGVLK